MHPILVKEPSLLLETLFKELPSLKKTKIKQILKFGSVCVNGRIITSHRHELKPGDKIDFLSQRQALTEHLKGALDFQIVYEDDELIVVDKPAGLLTMGTDEEKEKTVYFELMEYRRLSGKNDRGRIYIVHRLDRESSGLVVFAKNEAAKRTLQKNWDTVVKKYFAVTEGVPEEKELVVRSYLIEDRFKRVYSVRSASPEAKLAVTRYRLLGDNGRYALLDVLLETGRKNQIRVHLSDLGYPIVGDPKYGARSDPLGRMGLHAYFLSLRHPVTGQLKTFESKLPANFRRLISPSAKKKEG